MNYKLIIKIIVAVFFIQLSMKFLSNNNYLVSGGFTIAGVFLLIHVLERSYNNGKNNQKSNMFK